MTDIVERIKVEKWTNRDGEDVTSYRVSLVNETGQREVPCYDVRGKDLKEDAELPEGWEVKISKAGKPYLAAPRQSSGGGRGLGGPPSAAWRNTEDGAKYEQERMDRRTALMQSIAHHAIPSVHQRPDSDVISTAYSFYKWLRESVSAPRTGDAPSQVVQGQGTARTQAAPPVGADTPLESVSAPREKDSTMVDSSSRGVSPAGAEAASRSEGESVRVGADTPPDGGGEQLNSSAPQATPEAAPPSSTHASKWTPRENEPPHE